MAVVLGTLPYFACDAMCPWVYLQEWSSLRRASVMFYVCMYVCTDGMAPCCSQSGRLRGTQSNPSRPSDSQTRIGPGADVPAWALATGARRNIFPSLDPMARWHDGTVTW